MTENLPLVHTEAPDYGVFTPSSPVYIAASTSRSNAHNRINDFDLSLAEIYEDGLDVRGLYHPTTQMIPFLPDGRVLLTDKYERTFIKHRLRGQPYVGPPHIYDFASGGHITMSELSPSDRESLTLSDETALHCALRELNEELHSRGGEPLRRECLTFAGVYKYADEFNRELTYTYLCRLSGGVGDWYVLDDYIDRGGERREIELPVFALSPEELEGLLVGEGRGVEYKLQIGLECVLGCGFSKILGKM